ncbi:hypothetical protein B296_00046255 [Ensete ventricosum]|uniref:Uncharacterized protein n=1 Tax=Ensete ventricosum TaxID=4639 RepID=A0A426Z4J8_ENSVE|nr:hypothetical protein B296_00046255 [Ensete ventricosum]
MSYRRRGKANPGPNLRIRRSSRKAAMREEEEKKENESLVPFFFCCWLEEGKEVVVLGYLTNRVFRRGAEERVANSLRHRGIKGDGNGGCQILA